MVRKAKRSTSLRKIAKKTPGARNVIHFVEKKPKKAHCSNCGVVLHGIARARPIKISNMSKSSKRPQRPYGGMLCSPCTRRLIISANRQ